MNLGFRSDVALSVLLLLNRVSHDDVEQAVRIFGECSATRNVYPCPVTDTTIHVAPFVA